MTTIHVPEDNAVRDALRMTRRIVIAVAALLLLVGLFRLCTFTVGESEQAAVFRMGKIHTIILEESLQGEAPLGSITDSQGNVQQVRVVTGKGLFFKIPFVDRVKTYKSWLYTYVSQPSTLNTADKKQYTVTMYAQWRVANPALFSLRFQTTDAASQYLDNMVYPALVQQVNRMQAVDFLSNKGLLNESLDQALDTLNQSVAEGGIVLADIEVYRTLLPEANLQSTYDRMVANRQKVAQQLRSEGAETYQKAVSEADLEASKLIADATRQSKEIKGRADAKALDIYAKAYSKDSDFYGYWRSLQALETSLTHDATIVLDRNHPLWKDLLSMVMGQ